MKTPETPYVLIDMKILKNNIERMQKSADGFGCALRPHIKTHKSVEIARMQIEAGAAGITCAKLSEAEVFAGEGFGDIFIAYPIVGENKIMKAISLAKKIKRLIVSIDCVEGAEALSYLAEREGMRLETRIETETGAKRTGAPEENLRELGAELKKLRGINVTGVFTFRGMRMKSEIASDASAAGAEEGLLINEAAEIFRGVGFEIRDVSAGSTPTGLAAAKTGLVNEIRPGTYVFNDLTTMLNGACVEEDVAARVVATVVSVPSPEYAVIDAGSKTLAPDSRVGVPPLMRQGHAYIPGTDLIVNRLYEEHGIIQKAGGGETGLFHGETVSLIPAHICPVVNLHDFVFADCGGELKKIRVDARGCAR